MSRETRNLVLEMSAGVLLHNGILAGLTFLLCPRLGQKPEPIFWGLMAGMVSALAILIHMAVITERSLESGEQKYANKTVLIHTLGRKAVYIAVVFLVLIRLPQINPLAMIVGTMGLKSGAYLQPVLHKLLGKHSEEKEADGLREA